MENILTQEATKIPTKTYTTFSGADYVVMLDDKPAPMIDTIAFAEGLIQATPVQRATNGSMKVYVTDAGDIDWNKMRPGDTFHMTIIGRNEFNNEVVVWNEPIIIIKKVWQTDVETSATFYEFGWREYATPNTDNNDEQA